MNVGDVVATRNIRAYFYGGQLLSADYSAPQGKNFVFLFLGVEPKDGSAGLNVIDALEALGWHPEDELRKELAEKGADR